MKIGISLSLLAVVVFAAVLFFRWEEHYSSEKSPDGRFVVEVYKLKPWIRLQHTPGSSSDAPVAIYLKTSSGKTLQRWNNEILMNSGPVEWNSDYVIVGDHGYLFVPPPWANSPPDR